MDKRVRLWDCVTGKPLADLKHDDYIMTLAFSPVAPAGSSSAYRVAVGGGDKRVSVWDIKRTLLFDGEGVPTDGIESAVRRRARAVPRAHRAAPHERRTARAARPAARVTPLVARRALCIDPRSVRAPMRAFVARLAAAPL